MTALLSRFFIAVGETDLENVSLSGCKILGVFDVTWTANEKYSLRNSQNLPFPIQRQLSKKRKTFSQFFTVFVTFTLGFQYFEKKDDSHRLCISEVTDCQR